MIIFSFKEKKIQYDWTPVKATRWSLQLDIEQSKFSEISKTNSFFSYIKRNFDLINNIFFGFVFQSCFEENSIKVWDDSHTLIYGISWCNKNEIKFFKSNHGYYDGPHCSTSFGRFRISWYNGNCKKCQPWLLK